MMKNRHIASIVLSAGLLLVNSPTAAQGPPEGIGGVIEGGGYTRIKIAVPDPDTGGGYGETTAELVQTVKVDGALDELPDLLAEVVSSLRSALDARTAKVVGDRMSVTGEELPA